MLYHYWRRFAFDWRLFLLNKSEALATLLNTYGFVSIVLFIILPLIIFVVFFIGCKSAEKYFQKKISFRWLAAVLLLSNALFLIFSPAKTKGELVKFLNNNFFVNQEVYRAYSVKYQNYMAELLSAGNNLTSRFLPNANRLASDNAVNNNTRSLLLGDNIFFIHLESVSGYLVSEKVTPNLFRESQNGIYFKNFYSNAVQTLRSQECNLCGLPPAPRQSVYNSYSAQEIGRLFCLPKVLKNYGYASLFFKDDDLSFSHSGDFMLNIGFDEVHNSDIMQAGDPETKWGYREDVFFQRIFEYLDKNFQGQKIFVYIALSSTNHVPFTVDDARFFDVLPYPEAHEFQEYISNSTFVQDAYLSSLFDGLEKYRSNSSLFIFGDHAWPIGLHPNNIYNEAGAYEENFRSFLTLSPPTSLQNVFQIKKIVEARYSQMDILPTLMDLSGLNFDYLLGGSLTHEILTNASVMPKSRNSIVAIQPFYNSSIALINYPDKYLFGSKLYYYNLKEDPQEVHPVVLDNYQNYLYLIDDFFSQ